MPNAAPGLRSQSIACGLRQYGLDVTVTIPRSEVRKKEEKYLGPGSRALLPKGSVVIAYHQLPQFMETHRPDATIICNSNYFGHLNKERTGVLVFDFFAPKMLEAEAGRESAHAILSLAERKKSALAASDLVIVNGAKKINYVREWLTRAGRDPQETGIAVVNMAYDWPVPRATESMSAKSRGLGIVVAGYPQKWLRFGTMFEQILEFLESQPCSYATLILPGLSSQSGVYPEQIQSLMTHPRIRFHDELLFDDFARIVSSHDVFVDVFEGTPERELAMVTRSVCALGLGVPVIHPDFTEVSPLIAGSGAGWLVDAEDDFGLLRKLRELGNAPQKVVEAKSKAAELSRGALAPGNAVAPLVELLEREHGWKL